MATLYIVEQGAVVRKRGETILVELDGKIALEVELHRVETILIFGGVQISTQAMTEILEHGIELALLSLDGRLRGQLTPPLPKNVDLRVAQSNLATSEDFALRQARELIAVKIDNCLETLKQAEWRSVDTSLKETREILAASVEKAKRADDLNEINGIEGAAAHAYFTLFPLLLKKTPELFNGRSRRPPRDPVNALLSLGYTLLASRLQSLLDAHGFDPFQGWLHQPVYGRPSLALDLLEPYRSPYVDRWVIKMFNLGVFKRDDFDDKEEQGFRMTRSALKRFFVEWEKHLGHSMLREVMRDHLESVARVIRGKQDYPDHPRFKAV